MLRLILLYAVVVSCLVSESYADQQCNKYERWVNCPETMCIPLECSQVGYPVACPILGPDGRCPGKARCICIEGYARDTNGNCIPQKQCSKGDESDSVRITSVSSENSQSNGDESDSVRITSVSSEKSQSEIVSSSSSTSSSSSSSSRSSKYSRGSSSCKPRCKKNERWVNCPEAMCIPLKCSELGYPIACPSLGPDGRCPGKARCVCVEGYVRDCNGKCIPQKQCPSCGGDENSISGCGYQCGPQCGAKVDNSSHPMPCPCGFNECDCRRGYIYDNKQYKCVRPEHCTKSTTDPTTPTNPGTCSVDETLQLLQQGIADFTGKFLYEAYKSSPGKSLIMSPMSLFIPMGELLLCANGETLRQLIKVMNVRSKEDIRCVFPALTSSLRAEREIILNLAARIFSTDKYPLSQNFLDDTKNIFDAEAESLNFLNGEAAAERINEWVANETNDRIKDIATPDMFDDTTRLVLANAIYFLGNWTDQFNPNDTENRPFNTSSTNSVEIPTMYQQSTFKYAEVSNLDCKVIELPYKGGNFSFVVFLPNLVDGLRTLIEKLLNPNEFFIAYNSTTYEIVQVHLPRIKIESEYQLPEIMKAAGIIDIFDGTKSNLTNILEKYEPLYISAAKQKAFCEVDETGTEAAAANVLVAETLSAVYPPPPVYIFDANRPFIFYIFHKLMPIFCGTFVKAN